MGIQHSHRNKTEPPITSLNPHPHYFTILICIFKYSNKINYQNIPRSSKYLPTILVQITILVIIFSQKYHSLECDFISWTKQTFSLLIGNSLSVIGSNSRYWTIFLTHGYSLTILRTLLTRDYPKIYPAFQIWHHLWNNNKIVNTWVEV